MSWFGPKKDAMWRALSEEIGGDFVAGGPWSTSKVQAHAGPWTITLDTFTVSDGHTAHAYTRMRSPFVNPSEFRFTIYRHGFFSGIGRALGMQDVEVGDPEFDAAFVVKATDEGKVCDLLANPRLRALLMAQPHIRFQVKDDEGWFRTKFPEGVDELYFQAGGVLKDVTRLEGLFDLFAEALNQLAKMGAATKGDPGVTL